MQSLNSVKCKSIQFSPNMPYEVMGFLEAGKGFFRIAGVVIRPFIPAQYGDRGCHKLRKNPRSGDATAWSYADRRSFIENVSRQSDEESHDAAGIHFALRNYHRTTNTGLLPAIEHFRRSVILSRKQFIDQPRSVSSPGLETEPDPSP